MYEKSASPVNVSGIVLEDSLNEVNRVIKLEKIFNNKNVQNVAKEMIG
jgi:hypothetical protein